MTNARGDDRFTLMALALAVLVNLVAIDLPIMGSDDATLYAGIAAAMVRTGDYVGLYAWGQDWLDKPHLPFWLTALSFRLLGISPSAYRLPAFLAIVTAALYTYRLGTRLYGRPIGIWAAIALLTAQHTILSSGDVRAEPFVACFLIASTWHLVQVAEDERWLGSAVAGGLFAAAAMMTKGLFTVIPVVGALGGNWLLKGRPPIAWRRWAVAAVAAMVGITPELWALNVQFDSQPDKIVFGTKGVSGIRFYLWDSQFGRFLGTGPIRRSKSNPFYFSHTVLWAFLPWSFVMLLAVWRRAKLLWTRHTGSIEWYTVSGAGLMFAVFSVSQFQLAYYLNIIFPFLAILTASELARRAEDGTLGFVARSQGVVLTMMIGAMVAMEMLAQPEGAWPAAAGALLLLAAIPVVWRLIAEPPLRILVASVFAAVGVNLFLERGVLRALEVYEGGRVAAEFVNAHYADTPVIVGRDHQYTGFDFALAKPPRYLELLADTSTIATRPYLLLVENPGPKDPRTIRSFDYTVVSRPTLKVLNRRTRSKGLLRLDLVRVQASETHDPPKRMDQH